MPVSADIYSQVQQPRPLAPPTNPLAELAQAYQLKAQKSQIDASDRELSQSNELARLYQGAIDPNGKVDRNKLLYGVAQGGMGQRIPALQKGFSDADKSTSEAEKAQLESALKKFEVTGQLMSGVSDQASHDRARAQAAKIFGPEAAANIPPQFDPVRLAESQAQAVSVRDQMTARLEALKAAESARHNGATEATGRGNLEVAQGNLGVAQGNLNVSRERLATDKRAPKGQIVQTENGTMLVDPVTGEAKPVTADGMPVQRPGKEIPASVNKSIIENQQSLSKIDRAIAEIQKNPGALGTMYMLPGMETVGQYTDAGGVEARAGVADVGSLILHDRSGAAVTASETPRLRPFIPSAGDKPDVAIKKLQRFKEIAEEEAGLLSQTYGKRQGYRESPVLGGAPHNGPTARIAQQAKPIGASEPPAAAIAFLKANPGMRAQFEAKYGRPATGYLGQ